MQISSINRLFAFLTRSFNARLKLLQRLKTSAILKVIVAEFVHHLLLATNALEVPSQPFNSGFQFEPGPGLEPLLKSEILISKGTKNEDLYYP